MATSSDLQKAYHYVKPKARMGARSSVGLTDVAANTFLTFV